MNKKLSSCFMVNQVILVIFLMLNMYNYSLNFKFKYLMYKQLGNTNILMKQ